MTTTFEPTNPREMMRERTLLSMEAKAATLFCQGYVARFIPGSVSSFLVSSPDGNMYRISLGTIHCTCPAFGIHRTCKHLIGLRLLIATQECALVDAESKWKACEATYQHWEEVHANATSAERRAKAKARMDEAEHNATEACKAFEALKARLT